jgi:short-subunit dehydrogenase
VNDAGAFIYGRLDAVPLEDQRRLFDVTYWGMVHGTLIAAERLKHTGGAIINVGSVLGEIAIPYQGAYCAAKFAIKGFTEAFRREAEAERQPISLTLIKPAAINTPFTDHARNRMDSPGTRNPPPAYDPDLVARAIADACENPIRDLTIGGAGGISLVIGNLLASRMIDWITARVGHASMTTTNPGNSDQRDNLYEPRKDLVENSSLRPMTRTTSLALEAQLHPGVTVAAVAGFLTLYLAGRSRRTRDARR